MKKDRLSGPMVMIAGLLVYFGGWMISDVKIGVATLVVSAAVTIIGLIITVTR